MRRKVANFNKCWNNRFTPERPRLIERYADMGAQIHLHFVWHGHGELHNEYCARFERLHGYAGQWEADDHGGKQPVFVDVVHLIEPSQEGVASTVASLARLHTCDECASTLAHSAYMSLKQGFVVLGTLYPYRERDFGLGGAWIDANRLGRSEDQLVHEHVERGATVMDNFTGQDAESWRDVSDIRNAISEIRRVRVCLSDNRVWATINEPFDFSVEVLDVLIGPLYPFPAMIERGFFARGGHVAKSQTTKQGVEIPVPKRGDFLANLKKAATPEKKSPRRAPKKR